MSVWPAFAHQALERPALRLPDMLLVTSSLVALQTSARDAAAETLGRLAR
jgi:hypothetical protein